jgi:hypothetical protein
MLVSEILSRGLRDSKAVARYAGLTGAPDESGRRRREKGLAKAGNARVRRGMIQLAWRLLIFQKDSALAQWYRARMSCPRFLWTPYCPEKLEDDSVEGNGKTMIDAAGLVGSEGERGSSMLSITGQAAGAGPLAPGQRWSLARKHEVVLRLLRGEPVEAVSRQFGVPVWQLERWQARALAGLKTGLRERSEDPAERELAEAHRRIGELSMEVELLRARIERPGPLARRRSR